MSKTALLVCGDLHINSTVGLCPPTINLDDGGTYRSSKAQKKVFRIWEDTWQLALEETAGYRRIAVFMGDTVDYDKNGRTSQYVTKNKASAIDAATRVIEPIAEQVDGLLFIRGTEAHTGESGEFEEILASNFDNTIQDEDRGTSSWWHVAADVSGVRVDLAHHASMGGRPWTEKNAANTLASIVMMRYAERGDKLPHLALRGHVHRHADSWDNYPTRAIFTPAYQLKTAYIYRIGGEIRVSDLGMVVVKCDHGTYDVVKWIYQIKERESWRTKL